MRSMIPLHRKGHCDRRKLSLNSGLVRGTQEDKLNRTVLRQTDPFSVDRRQWLNLVAGSLGNEVESGSLAGETKEAVPAQPLDEQVPSAMPLTRADPQKSFHIVQRLDDPDPARANAQAREDLENGATGLALVFGGAPNAFGYGLPANFEGLQAVLADLPLKNLLLRIDVHPQSRASVDWLVEVLRNLRADPEEINLSFGIDPASLFAGTGRLRMSIEALEASMPQSLAGYFALSLPGILLEADGRVFHNAGATEAQELGIVLASAVGHLRMFEQARQPLIYGAEHIGFAVAVDQHQFLSIAKIRALRKLWNRVLVSRSVEGVPVLIHAETSYRMLTTLDPETNKIRSTLAAFAAVIGGADSISVLPHTIAHGLPDSDARRLARNTQLVLAEESNVNFLADPAGGSSVLEAMTEQLCESAWEEFQTIEKEGGVLRSLAAGHIQERIASARAERLKEFSDNARNIIGTTAYRRRQEPPVSTLSAPMQAISSQGAVTCEPLPAERFDEMPGLSREP